MTSVIRLYKHELSFRNVINPLCMVRRRRIFWTKLDFGGLAVVGIKISFVVEELFKIIYKLLFLLVKLLIKYWQGWVVTGDFRHLGGKILE